jgi:ACS family glucarate transporter-like MFS transporter
MTLRGKPLHRLVHRFTVGRMIPTSPAPTRVRYGVLGFACSLAAITYLDRLCIGSAAPYLRDSLGLSNVKDLGNVFAAFSLSYAIFEVPTGWLGDVYGPRSTLIRIVLWWSLFTALTSLAGVTLPGGFIVGVGTLVAIRFLFGIGEAGAFPNITRALHNWLPLTERGTAQGLVWMSGRFMGGVTPLIWMFLVEEEGGFGLGWRSAFVLFGILGVCWCVAFASWFRNRPEEKATVNDAELAVIRAGTEGTTEQAHANVPWGQLLRSRNLWAICLMYFFMSYGWYFNVNYLPSYLEEMHEVAKSSVWGSVAKGGPLLVGAVGCIVGGWLTDAAVRRTGNRKWSRRVFGMFGHGVCVPLYLYCVVAPNAWTFAVALALTGFFNDLAMGQAWATCQDIGRRHAAIVAGCMNTVGNLGGFASSKIIAWLLDLSSSGAGDLASLSPGPKKAALLPGYEWNFYSFAALYAIAMMLWLCIDATKPVLAEDAAPATPGV